MIEVRLFATFREGRGKILHFEEEACKTGLDILREVDIPQEEVAIFLINGRHRKPEDLVKEGDVIAIFPPVGGG